MARPPRTLVLLALGLVLAVGCVYAQVRGHDFINFDDRIYVHQNPHVNGGLTWAGVRAHVTQPWAAYWLPLTWTSLALDVSLWGVNAGAMKLTNVALHAVATVLLLLACARLTGALWPSALVAAIFALHPLHVESVAWVAERKDVLSAVFGMLTLLAYAYWVERPGVWRGAAVIVAYALGLLAKPTLVVLPLVLLLLDVWPLRRVELAATRASLVRAGALVLEKGPLFVLAAAASAIVLYTQSTMGAREVAEWLPPQTHAAIVLESFGWYLLKTLWPSGLAVLYPVPTSPPPLWPGILATLAVLLLTALVILGARRRPFLLVGWIWFLAMLLPVAGFFHVGIQSRADRWMYWPMIGLSLIVAFALAEVVARWPQARTAVVGTVIAVLLVLGVVSWVQVGHWENTMTTFAHAIDVTDGNYYAWESLAEEHRAAGRLDLAEIAYVNALSSAPRWARPREHLADMWEQQGDPGAAAAMRGVVPLAWSEPYGAAALGVALVRAGRFAAARPFVETALREEPRSPELHTAMAVIAARTNDREAAERYYAQALALEPRLYSTAANLAWLRATAADASRRQPDEAQRLATAALNDLRVVEPALLDALAAAHAANGKFAEAIATAERALAAAERAEAPQLIAPIRARLARYRQGKPAEPDSPQWPPPAP